MGCAFRHYGVCLSLMCWKKNREWWCERGTLSAHLFRNDNVLSKRWSNACSRWGCGHCPDSRPPDGSAPESFSDWPWYPSGGEPATKTFGGRRKKNLEGEWRLTVALWCSNQTCVCRSKSFPAVGVCLVCKVKMAKVKVNNMRFLPEDIGNVFYLIY